jgi:hypothetical protein
LEDHAKLFFEQVGAMERAVAGLDADECGALLGGEVGWVFPRRPPGLLDRSGLIGASGAARLGGQPTADLIKGLGGLGPGREGIQAQHGFRARSVTTVWMNSAPLALTWVNARRPVRARSSKNWRRVAAVRSLSAQTSRLVS